MDEPIACDHDWQELDTYPWEAGTVTRYRCAKCEFKTEVFAGWVS